MAQPLDDAILLHFAAKAPPSHPRRALMLAEAGGLVAAQSLPLGQRDAALMHLRAGWFGADCPCLDACPTCTRAVEFDLPLAGLAVTSALPDGTGWRALTTDDLLAVEALPPRAARQALAQAVTGVVVGEDQLPEVSSWLIRADPLARVVLDLTCAHCGAAWGRPFDIVRHLWADLAMAGRNLLNDIHMLARSYHWSEAEILVVPAARRRVYLDMIAL